MCGDGRSLAASGAHSLQEMLILMKLLGASVENQVQSHHRCALLDFSPKSPSFFNLDDSYYDTTGIIYYNYNSDNRQ